MSGYLFQSILDNSVHDITYEQIKELYEDNLKEEREGKQITAASYCGENYYTPQNQSDEFEKEILLRDPKTAGLLIQYPHGVIIEHSLRRNYYRGEKQLFSASVPSLHRKLNSFSSQKEKELYRLVSDMRIAEFSFFLRKFEHVNSWTQSDVLYEALAQHYGLETGWLDITTDFNVALFFATCFYDSKTGNWMPLTKEQTEHNESKKYGMIFHIPSNIMSARWAIESTKFVNYTDEIVGYSEEGNPIHELVNLP